MLALVTVGPASAQQQPQKPNMLVIMGGDYVKWFVEHLSALVPVQAIVAQQTFQGFPPRQKPGTFSDRAMES